MNPAANDPATVNVNAIIASLRLSMPEIGADLAELYKAAYADQPDQYQNWAIWERGLQEAIRTTLLTRLLSVARNRAGRSSPLMTDEDQKLWIQSLRALEIPVSAMLKDRSLPDRIRRSYWGLIGVMVGNAFNQLPSRLGGLKP